MPRKQRVEYPGATYHVISRGNCRKDLFTDPETAETFETTIFEVVERCSWKLFSYVLMKNHYHLAIKTPEPNLVAGMKWLQGTFATRFNQFHGERGHVFQGRYKSLVVDPDRSLLGLIDFIHLNPVRAGLCDVDDLKFYRFSSFSDFWKRVPRPGLNREVVMSLIGASDNLAGVRKYQQHLALCDEVDPKKRDALYLQYRRGWFIGSKRAKKELGDELAHKNPNVEWEGRDLTANNPWVAKRLHMGHPSRVTNLMRSSDN